MIRSTKTMYESTSVECAAVRLFLLTVGVAIAFAIVL